MRCPACGFENASGIKFCGECGSSLKLRCSSCGFENGPSMKFCGECGKPFAEAAKSAPSPDPRSYTPKHLAEKILQSKSAVEGERKQVTVLFADVKGSMDLAEQLDPEEWHGLLDRFFAIRQVVLLSAEPGLGKSRLAHELRERIGNEELATIELQCSPFYRNTPLQPIVDYLSRILGFAKQDSPEQKLDTLDAWLNDYGLPVAEAAPLLASLLSFTEADRYPLLNMTPQRRRQKTLELLIAWLLKEAERNPLVVVWEDLHWADPTTLELLSLLVDQAPTARLLGLLTHRPEFTQPWGNRSHLTQLSLSRLGREQVEGMASHVAGGKALPEELLAEIVARTDGVPLFVEELTRMLLESGYLKRRDERYELTRPLERLAIPSTLQSSLMARLDRLGDAKEVAQLGAVLGREFSYELLQAVSRSNEESLKKSLGKLVKAELLFQRGLAHTARYIFKHALVQDAAYRSLLQRRRQELHKKITDTLRECSADAADIEPELLAHHYTEAREIAEAVPLWQRATDIATRRSAYEEAIARSRRGIEATAELPDGEERWLAELRLQVALCWAIQGRWGFASPKQESAYTRGIELAGRLGERPEAAKLLYTRAILQGSRATFTVPERAWRGSFEPPARQRTAMSSGTSEESC
jgi:predicted ATPase